MAKIIFFDIDNTLWDEQMQIPASTVEAVRKLKANGHLCFICTGRARGNLVSKELMSLPFDGIVAACGNHIEYAGKLIYQNLLPQNVLKHAIEVMKKYQMPMVVEGPVDHWIDEKGFEEDGYVDYLHEVLGEHALPLYGYEPGMLVSKISTLILPQTNVEAIRRELAGELDILEHPGKVWELIPPGTSKAWGIDYLCRYLEIANEDTYAIGDSANDLEMLEFVKHGICMGNGTEAAKQAAEYVTADIHEDGLYKAMEHYGLIG